jgi:hypothetical protein
MATTKRLKVILVQFGKGDGVVLINVQPQIVLDDGGAADVGSFVNVVREEAALTASPNIRANVEAIINAEKVEVKAAIPAVAEIPAVPAVFEDDGTTVKTPAVAAVPGVAAVPAVMGPRFDTTTIVWS